MSPGPTMWLASLFVACSTPRPAPEDEGREAAAPEAPTKARAFVVDDPRDLIPGPAAQGKVGDVRIDNGRVAFIVSAVDHEGPFTVSGGNLLDAAPAGGRDSLGEIFGQLGPFPNQGDYDTIAIEERAEAVVVRASGRESQDPDVEVTTEYELRDGSPVLQIRTTLVSRRETPVPERPLGDAIGWGAARRFVPGFGFERPDANGVPFFTAVGIDGSYAYGSQGARVAGDHGRNWTDSVVVRAALAPGEQSTFRRFLAVVPGANAAAAAAVAHAHRGERTREAGIVIAAERAGPDESFFVRVDDAKTKKPALWFRARATERTALPLRRGRYTARVVGPARASAATPFVVDDGGDTLELPAGDTASVEVSIADEAGAPSPARLVVTGREGTADPDFGPWTQADGQATVVHAPAGHAKIALAPGRYRVRASRGPEWEIAAADFEARSGRDARANLVLRRTVDTTGYVAADLHQHVFVSVDSGTTIRDRVIANVCEGVELVVSTDHNVLTDFAPTIAELGLAARVRSIVGDEVTPDVSRSPGGHFNVFPMTPDPTRPRGGAFDARDLPPAEIFARAQAGDHPRVVQVNHPRSPANGFFGRAQIDARTGLGNGLWDPGFDAVEVWNAKRFSQLAAVLEDVRAFWTRGIPYTATGNSDTHELAGQEAGYPRTYIRVPTEDLAALREEDVVTTLRTTHDAIVTNGPFIRLDVDGTSTGGFVTLAGRPAHLRIEVQAASWIEVGTLEVVVSGASTTEPIPRTEGQPVRYVHEVDLTPVRDSWVQVIVRGETPLLDHEEPALAFTNPIWLDMDGNGRYDAPQ